MLSELCRQLGLKPFLRRSQCCTRTRRTKDELWAAPAKAFARMIVREIIYEWKHLGTSGIGVPSRTCNFVSRACCWKHLSSWRCAGSGKTDQPLANCISHSPGSHLSCTQSAGCGPSGSCCSCSRQLCFGETKCELPACKTSSVM